MANTSTAAIASALVDVAFVYEAAALGGAVLVVLTAAALHLARDGSWRVVQAASGAYYGRADTHGDEGLLPRPLKLRSYRPGRMATMGFVTVVLSEGIRATVYYSMGLWVQVMLSVGWTFLLARTASENSEEDAFLGSLYKDYAVGFRTLTAFILGGYVSEILKRWWAARLLCAQLIGNANSLAMFAFAFIRPPPLAPAAAAAAAENVEDDNCAGTVVRPVQETVCRYVVLVVELVHLQGRQARPIEHHPLAQMCHSLCSRSSCCCHERCYDSLKLSDKLSELVARGRCTEEERQILSATKANHYQVVLSWLLALLNDAAEQGFIAREQLIGAQTSAEKMRQAGADLMVYVTTLLPFPYVQLVTFIVKFQVFLTFTDLAYDTLTTLLNGHNEITAENWTAVAGFVVFMVAVASFFEGLLRLHELLANPLDDQLCSWNVEDMIESLHGTTRQTACRQQTTPVSCSVAGCGRQSVEAQGRRVSSSEQPELEPELMPMMSR